MRMERLDDMQIVVPGPGDALGLARVHVTAWRESYRGLLPSPYLDRMSVPLHTRRWRRQLMTVDPPEIVLAAEAREGLVGYCGGRLGPDSSAEVSTLYLVRAAQKLGLGRRLLAAAASVFEAQGAHTLTLWVLNGNRAARGFYEHLGGLALGDRPVRGWGGDHRETAIHWPRIALLSRPP